ncbi:IgGFc-binding protein-like isoform X1 [Erythrolamprus reginae]|uniref:IgGFc-binding protein-like isoform X1 n=2 Tax=Erythrolamprus reginae TaxID=121349 RepID=UPI00396CB80B
MTQPVPPIFEWVFDSHQYIKPAKVELGYRLLSAAMGTCGLLPVAIGLALLTGLHAVTPIGQEFITAFMQNDQLDYSKAEFQLLISGNIDQTKVNVLVYKSTFQKEFSLPLGTTVVVTIPAYVETFGTVKFCHTVLVTANQNISVVALSRKGNSSDTTVVYPIQNLGMMYYVLTPWGAVSKTYKEFSVIAWDKETRVEIHLEGPVRFQDIIHPAGTKLDINLLPYEAVQLQSSQDLSGSLIRATRPVAVLSGHSCAQVYTECSHVVEQLLPVQSWGHSFFLLPLSFQIQYGVAYVVTSQATTVTYASGGTHKTYDLKLGQRLHLKVMPSKPIYITATVGIQVFLFCPGGTHSGRTFRPFFLTIPDVLSYCTSYSFESQAGFENYAFLVAKTAAAGGLTMDGDPLGGVSWKEIAGTGYSWSEYILGNEECVHSIQHPDSPFSLISMGIANGSSYGEVGICQKETQPLPTSAPIQCRKKETYQMQNGQRVCVPQSSATCWARGDPHYQTFDRRRYDFMGTCTYTVAKTCGPDTTLPAFHVTVKNENRGVKSVSYVGSVTVQVYGYDITIVRKEHGFVRVNNQRFRLPVSLMNQKLRLFQSGTSAIVETDFLLTVSYDWNSNFAVKISSSFSENVCGLCGNYNEKPDDDFRTSTGSLAAGPVDFGQSWKVEDGDPLCWSGCHGECKKVTQEKRIIYRGDTFCGWISKKDGPFSKCNSLVDPDIFVENCVYDLFVYEGHREALCEALKSYMDACQQEGGVVLEWRNLIGCPLPCPENSVYKICGPACPATCGDEAPPPRCSSSQCVESCQCKDGFVMDAGKCIPRAACGCLFEGRLLAPNEAFWGDATCTKRCTCDPQTKKVKCQDTKCHPKEQCQVKNGIQNCYPLSYGTCSAISHSHYHGFDGHSFNFQGTCLYRFAGLSQKKQGLVDFQISVQNSPHGGWSGTPKRMVKIEIYNLEITVSWAFLGRIMINGRLTNLPYKLGPDQIIIYQKSWETVIQTDFGLTVTFSWQSQLTVTVPATYQGALNGLCGNFNGDKQDDTALISGGQVTDPKAFGKLWKVAEFPGCGEVAPKVCPDVQSVAQMQRSKSTECGLLVDKNGPFRECHGKINPEMFFLDCVSDYCTSNSQTSVLGYIIAAYASACQVVRVTIYTWRIHIVWKLTCPPNSHYELCSRSCQQTCDSLYSSVPCSTYCTQGCVCDEGFVRSGDRCVPLHECGCTYQDQYYMTGETFYPTSDCNMKCTCQAGGAVTCHKVSCGPNEECKMVDGVQKCHPMSSATCSASGDPHYLSFDGVPFNFQGTCSYILAKTAVESMSDLTPFTVTTVNEPWGNGKVSVVKQVSVEVYGFKLTLVHKKKGQVQMNGVFRSLPVELSEGHLKAYQQGTKVLIKTSFGLVVSYDLVYHVRVTVPSSYRKRMQGLCGNYNGMKEDEFLLPSGKKVTDVAVFGASWKVSVLGAGGPCSDGCSGSNCPICNEEEKNVFKQRNYCGILTAPDGPLQGCHNQVDPSVFFNNCIYDLCQNSGNSQALCQSIQSYVSACQEAKVLIQPWRSPSFCPLSCPPHSHYEECADFCTADCFGQRVCPETCAEGCQCDLGYFFDGLGCVSVEGCGCFGNGSYYRPNEKILLNECQQTCQCFPGQGLLCESYHCSSDEECRVQDGIMSCVNKDPCKTLQCRIKEMCKVKNGKASCVPMYNETCYGWGDPHYRTFDGLKVDFQGTCTYTLAKYCGSDTGLVPFVVDHKNENRGRQDVSFVRHVNIRVYGYNISIGRSHSGKIQLNGLITNLPVTLEDGKIHLFQSGMKAILQTDFGLEVSFDGASLLSIILSSSYYGSLCGLCGNFNQNPDDDMTTAAGHKANSSVEWAASWKVKDRDPFCWHHCKGKCPTCEQSKRELFGSDQFCGLITKSEEGPFRKCHPKLNPDDIFDSCIYDVCLNGGAKSIFCNALETYAFNCRKEGVIITDWRTKSGCALPCPENSHYEACGSACPNTCSERTASASCKLPCVETCQCNEGYILSVDQCVHVGSCGCTYNGLYYKPEQEFWGDEYCTSRCRCDPKMGIVVCEPASCKASEICRIDNGIQDCYSLSFATCSVMGNHHYITFDGQKYDFTGTCLYQLVGLCAKDPALTPFAIRIQNSQGRKILPFSSVMTLEVYNMTITISQDHPDTIQVDGVLVDLPFYYEDKIQAYLSGNHLLIKTQFDLSMIFSWNRLVHITVPGSYLNAICGVCGNGSQKRGRELTMRNGAPAANFIQFADSWKEGESPGCVNGCTSNCPGCSENEKQIYRKDHYCGVLSRKDGPFRHCHIAINPQSYFDSCVLDACLFKGHQSILCSAIAAYATVCQAQGIQIDTWRSASFCSPSCPHNSHYELCGDGCPVTCHGLSAPDGCKASCKEGCYCNAGFVLSGDECVPIGECGCLYQGRYYKKGDEFSPGASCQHKCRCGENGAVECRKVFCGPQQQCGIEKGKRACHPRGYGKCSVSGGSHYLTLDGEIFNFLGSCSYTLVEVRGRDPELVDFSVVVENESNQEGKVIPNSIVITLRGYVIRLGRGMTWQAQVNEEIHTLPLTIKRRSILIYQDGKNVVVQTDFGFGVLYDSSQFILVVIPSTYQGQVCGLCGNFNGERGDEFQRPDGTLTTNVTTFGVSWKVSSGRLGCSDDCRQNCPSCTAPQIRPYQGESSCGLIKASSGPFKACHLLVKPEEYFNLCLYEMCAAHGATEALCRSLQAYVAVCQAAGAIIKSWRTAAFCPLTCSPNSHYELCTRSCDFTCAGLSSPIQCIEKCFEGCQCDDGYFSDGEKCISLDNCGCVHDGRYMKAEESVLSWGCSEKCTCHGSGQLACNTTSCPQGEVCALQNGRRGCFKQEAECHLSLQAELTTFDGVSGTILYDGAYVMASLCDEAAQRWFRLVVDFRGCNGKMSSVSAIYMFFQEGVLAVNQDKEVWVNGRQVNLPASLFKTVSVSIAEDVVTIGQGMAVQVLFDLKGEVTVKVKQSLEGKLCGSCRNFNGDLSDDLTLPNGQVVGDISEVIDAWRARDFIRCEQ